MVLLDDGKKYVSRAACRDLNPSANGAGSRVSQPNLTQLKTYSMAGSTLHPRLGPP